VQVGHSSVLHFLTARRMYSLSKEGRPDDWWRKPTAETRFGLNSVSRQRTTREANHRVTPPAAVQQVAQQVDRGESDNASTSEHSSQSTRSIPLTGESTEEFFSSPSRNVISYRKTPSSTLSKSRTVSSLRNSPNRNMVSLPSLLWALKLYFFPLYAILIPFLLSRSSFFVSVRTRFLTRTKTFWR
jgi:hypothetical protein